MPFQRVAVSLLVSQQQDVETLQEDEIGGSVTMSRALAVSAHGLTLNEARLMMLACRLIDPRKSPYVYAKDGYVRVRVTADEFAQLANMVAEENRTPTAAYEGLKAACDKLFERRASWREGKKIIRLAWVWKATYHEGEGWAEVCFSPDMTQHLFMLGQKFVRYRLELAKGLRSIYSANLLRLLMTQQDTGFLAITLEDFRRAMEVPDSYRFADIKRYAILPPITELQEKSDLVIQFNEVKRGRSVYSLRFTFKRNPQGRLPL
jgi:plasmid replication initiation protein